MMPPMIHGEMPVLRAMKAISPAPPRNGSVARLPVIRWPVTPSTRSTPNWAASRQAGGARPGLSKCLSSENTTQGAISLASCPVGTSSGSVIASTCGSAMAVVSTVTYRRTGRYSASNLARSTSSGTGLDRAILDIRRYTSPYTWSEANSAADPPLVMRSSRDRQPGPFRQSLSTLLRIAFASTTPRKRGASEQYGSRCLLATISVTCSYSTQITVAVGSDIPAGSKPGPGRRIQVSPHLAGGQNSPPLLLLNRRCALAYSSSRTNEGGKNPSALEIRNCSAAFFRAPAEAACCQPGLARNSAARS